MLPSLCNQDFTLTPHGTETILLTEMDNGVRAYIQFALSRFGYTVLQATDGREAAQRYEAHAEPIHLLIADMRMGGGDMAEVLVTMHPETRVLFLVDPEDDMVHDKIAQERVAFIQKPFSPDALACKVREVLDRAKGDRWQLSYSHRGQV